MASEGLGQTEKAKLLFEQAWTEAIRILKNSQPLILLPAIRTDTNGKLKWDETALEMALKIDQESMKASYPSLYLNIGKCHEDLKVISQAEKLLQPGICSS